MSKKSNLTVDDKIKSGFLIIQIILLGSLFVVLFYNIIESIFINPVVETQNSYVDVVVTEKINLGSKLKLVYAYKDAKEADVVPEKLYINTEVGDKITVSVTTHIYKNGETTEYTFIEGNLKE